MCLRLFKKSVLKRLDRTVYHWVIFQSEASPSLCCERQADTVTNIPNILRCAIVVLCYSMLKTTERTQFSFPLCSRIIRVVSCTCNTSLESTLTDTKQYIIGFHIHGCYTRMFLFQTQTLFFQNTSELIKVRGQLPWPRRVWKCPA
jgi:hypothetical protein